VKYPDELKVTNSKKGVNVIGEIIFLCRIHPECLEVITTKNVKDMRLN